MSLKQREKKETAFKKKHLIGLLLCAVLIVESTVLAVRWRDTGKASLPAPSQSAEPSASPSPKPEDPDEKKVEVTVSGRVKKPGTYAVPVGTVMWDVIEKAGGFLKNAKVDEDDMNRIVTGKCTLRIGSQEYFPVRGDGTPDPFTADGKLNINLAQEYDLENLPGIGEKTAGIIVSYREEQGIIRELEELMQIEGITKSIYNKLLDYVTMDY